MIIFNWPERTFRTVFSCIYGLPGRLTDFADFSELPRTSWELWLRVGPIWCLGTGDVALLPPLLGGARTAPGRPRVPSPRRWQRRPRSSGGEGAARPGRARRPRTCCARSCAPFAVLLGRTRTTAAVTWFSRGQSSPSASAAPAVPRATRPAASWPAPSVPRGQRRRAGPPSSRPACPGPAPLCGRPGSLAAPVSARARGTSSPERPDPPPKTGAR